MMKQDTPEDRSRYAKMTKEECLQAFKRIIAHPHLEAADKVVDVATTSSCFGLHSSDVSGS